MPGKRVDQFAAVLGIVEHYNGLFAACVAICREQCAQLAQQRVRRWQSVAGGAGRAGGSALAATGADVPIDSDVIPRRRDRPSRAEIEATAAANDAGARMRTQILGEGNVTWFVERTGKISRLQHCAHDRNGITGVSA